MDGSSAIKPAQAKLTPMMAQYFQIKEQARDALLFYRMGDFYELFFDDAVQAAAALDITLTRRGQHNGDDIPMCGVPWHSHEGYLARLIKAGFRVAICEQTESPAEAKKRGAKSVVQREIVRLVTAGTITEDALLSTRENNFLAAIAMLPSDTAGIAWADLSTGEVSVQVSSRQNIASDIAALAPREVLVPDNMPPDWREALQPAGVGDRLTYLAQASFSVRSANSASCEFYNIASLDAFGEFSTAEVSALGAMLDYIQLTQVGERPVLKAPARVKSGGAMIIDAVTRSSLELVSTQKGEYGGSLLSAIDQTVTGPGGRLLTRWLASPLTVLGDIRARQNAVTYFVEGGDIRALLRERLKMVSDMARAFSRLSLNRGGPRDLATIRDAFVVSFDIAACLDQAEAPALESGALPAQLEQIRADLSPVAADVQTLRRKLERALAETLPLLSRDGGFIASGFDEVLDEAISLRDNAKQVMAGLENEYRQLADCKSLKVKFNNVLGYFIEVPAGQADKLREPRCEDIFIHRQTLANNVRYTTVELSDLASRILAAKETALSRELEIFAELISDCVVVSETIAKCAEGLAKLDVYCGLAELAAQSDYVRPEMTEALDFNIIEGRHPVVETTAMTNADGGTGRFIPNNCELNENSAPSLWLVTGPNMAGKSTFLRQNALITILAQIGSYVPARKATLGIVDRIFSRVGAADDLAKGRSTFMVEMVETAAILNQATDRSLVVLDEIGRGTATYDGLSIAWAAVEHLHDVNKCRGLFATHYHELTALSSRLDQLVNVSMQVQEWKQEVIFLHEVKRGPADRSYGVAVARLAGLPPNVIQRAEEILRILEEGEVAKPSNLNALMEDLPLFAAQPAVEPDTGIGGEVVAALQDIDPYDLSPRQALDTLFNLKDMVESR